MSPRPVRSRLLDLAVATVCVACVGAPFLALGNAAGSAAPDPSVFESGGNVDQRVVEGGTISNPLNGSFGRGTSGVVDGSLQWDVYSTSAKGLKLLVSSDRDPALRDAQNGVDVADYAAKPAGWSVDGSERRFGFSVTGPLTLSRFDEGRKWRGFSGTRPIEVARRAAPLPNTRTTVRLRAEYGAALASNARPAAHVDATAVLNL